MTYKGNRLLVTILGVLLVPGIADAQVPDDDALSRRIASTVREGGTIQSRSSLEIRCQAPGQSTILSVVPEGTAVKEGDQLLTLDTAALELAIDEQQIKLAEAEAAARGAKAAFDSLVARQLAIQKLLVLQAQASKLERQALLGEGGELDQQLQEAEGRIKIGRAQVAAVETRIGQWREREQQAGKLLPADLELMRTEAQEMLRAASARREFVHSILRPSESAKFEVEKSRQRMELSDELQEVERELVLAKGKSMANDLVIAREQQQLAKLRENLKNCVVTAPQAGTVVYANQPSRTGGFVVEPGATVRERQVLIELPDLSNLQVRTTVNETRISQVRVGQTAVVRIEALPDETIKGVVTSVARTPEPASWLNGDVKEYIVLVDLSERPDFVRIGMSALVEIDTTSKRQK